MPDMGMAYKDPLLLQTEYSTQFNSFVILLVHLGKKEPRAVSASSAEFKGGANGKTTGVSRAKSGDSTTLLWDVTFPSACARCRRARLGDDKRRGAAAAQEELEFRK